MLISELESSPAQDCSVRSRARPSNKELKLTKPSIMELRSLTPVFGGPAGGARGKLVPGSATDLANGIRPKGGTA